MDPIDSLIAAIAVTQNGNIARWQLLGLGLSSNAIHNRGPDWSPSHRLSGRVPRRHPGDKTTGTRRGRGSRLRSARVPEPVVGDDALGVLAQLARAVRGHADERQPPPQRHLRLRSTILTEEEVTEHHEIPVTKPARTSFDMIARIPRDSRDRTVSRALNTPYLTRGQLQDQLERTPNHPAAHLIVPHVITKNGPTKSDWERELPPYCTRHNLPIPIMGYEIGPNRTVDAFWELGGPVRGIIIELDSVEYHLDRFAFKDDRGRDKDHLALRLPTYASSGRRCTKRRARRPNASTASSKRGADHDETEASKSRRRRSVHAYDDGGDVVLEVPAGAPESADDVFA
jgi:hypothetical protein